MSVQNQKRKVQDRNFVERSILHLSFFPLYLKNPCSRSAENFDPKLRDMVFLKCNFLKNVSKYFAEIVYGDAKLMPNKALYVLRRYLP